MNTIDCFIMLAIGLVTLVSWGAVVVLIALHMAEQMIQGAEAKHCRVWHNNMAARIDRLERIAYLPNTER